MVEFKSVWFSITEPQKSMTAYKQRRTGSLVIDNDAAMFTDANGTVRLTAVEQVSIGKTGTDTVNKWVRVTCAVDGQRRTVYLNDARGLGWRPLLTKSNHEISAALMAISPDSMSG